MNTVERKREIRNRIAERRRSVTEIERGEASRRLCDRIASLPFWSTAASLAAFWPLGKEPDIAPVLRRWIEQGKTLALPRVEGPNPGDMKLYRIADPAIDLIPGTLGILEPDVSRCAVFLPESVEWILVPGVAYDLACHRLGRGKAYYDTLLPRVPPRARRTGVGYDWQIIEDAIPLDPWDQPLDSVVTDRRVVYRENTAE